MGIICHRSFAVTLLLLALAPFPESQAMDFGNEFKVDLNKYAGVWYEVGRTPNSFEDNKPRRRGERFSACYNATAEYALEGPGRISVTNTCLRESAKGTVIKDVAKGRALVIEGSGNRKLEVAFGPWIARFFQRLFSPSDGNYWIYCLGPEEQGRYSWAVIGNKKKSYIFLLSRDRLISEVLKDEIVNCAREAGLPVEKLVFRQRRK